MPLSEASIMVTLSGGTVMEDPARELPNWKSVAPDFLPSSP